MVVERDRKLILYGFNNICKNLIKIIGEKQYNLVAVIDREFTQEYDDKLHFYKINIEHIKELGNIEDCIVIICLNDGIKHKLIADKLYDSGARYILYLPMSIYDGDLSRQASMRVNYNRFIHGDFESVDVIEYMRIINKYIVIRRDKYNTSFWCPIKYIYTGTIDMAIDKNMGNVAKKYVDCKVEELMPYLELYKNIENGIEMSLDEEYFLIQRDNVADRKLLYENKKKLFKTFEAYLQFDLSMFSDSPACGRFNKEKRRINLADGLHRTLFLIYKGYKQIPIRILNGEYDSFMGSTGA